MEEGGRKWEERSSIIKGISKIAATTPASLEAKGESGRADRRESPSCPTCSFDRQMHQEGNCVLMYCI